MAYRIAIPELDGYLEPWGVNWSEGHQYQVLLGTGLFDGTEANWFAPFESSHPVTVGEVASGEYFGGQLDGIPVLVPRLHANVKSGNLMVLESTPLGEPTASQLEPYLVTIMVDSIDLLSHHSGFARVADARILSGK
jgi:hypothetical protein